ncbi:Hypothetical_protein [Hexamita inflata]|uniref:Hypothetical_protein n=1 Tax=Hexamita inflata TaxID=28002 RepID=A0AA86N8R5_9EUKA|nr:Hypothetical protein HINF_LOCUS2421 [Hexamita inflata]
MTYNEKTECLNACSNGYCKYSYTKTYRNYQYTCEQNPTGIYNTLSSCNSNCSNGYCNETYHSYHQRYEYNCIPNGIYDSYSACCNNCYDGYCASNYSYSHSRYEYTCINYTHDNPQSGYWFLLLLLIPVLAILLTTIICGCSKKRRAARTAKKIQKQALKQERDNLIIQTVTEVTLPNGQTGLFVPLTQTQQDKLHYKTNQIQIYYPQPIYQPQPVQMVALNDPQFQTIQNPQVVQMPIMPAMPL